MEGTDLAYFLFF